MTTTVKYAVASSKVEFEAKVTPVVLNSCIMAATGGLMFGYDLGISGGVVSMPSFLKEFFPEVYERTQNKKGDDNNYCKYDNQELQMFTSSLYVAALISTLIAAYTSRVLGRKQTMVIAGIFFIVGTMLNATAISLCMLIFGRICLGCGVGFANQAVPLFLSEIAPSRMRGALNMLFQFDITVGIMFANLVNYGTSKIQWGWGWRLSMALAGVPAMLLTIGAISIDDTPNSLIQRGYLEKGKLVLSKIRGTDKIESEYLEIVEASRNAGGVENPFAILLIRQNRPPLVIAILFQVCQQLTGMNAIMFYAPVLFNTLGFGNDASLYSSAITGIVNAISTLVSIYMVDKVGRRLLLLEAGVQMFVSQTIIAVVMGLKLQDDSNNLSQGLAVLVVLMVCTFVSSYAWSWGPLGWLIPSEIFPLGTRSSGQSVTVCVNMMFTFMIAQSFLSMLCYMKYWIFLFFSICVIVMSLFVYFLVPETNGVPIEEMTERVWKQHWFWKRYI
ncbi:hypothetical protein IC575_013283 [Cucumis melo]|uniref:Sugar transport protein 13-like n=1 Tax=Cucumis melo TaxID=3656 RepID=A0A1S3AYL5_CUCME|nr:sugar transport protein 13-like [Cucumis melo]